MSDFLFSGCLPANAWSWLTWATAIFAAASSAYLAVIALLFVRLAFLSTKHGGGLISISVKLLIILLTTYLSIASFSNAYAYAFTYQCISLYELFGKIGFTMLTGAGMFFMLAKTEVERLKHPLYRWWILFASFTQRTN